MPGPRSRHPRKAAGNGKSPCAPPGLQRAAGACAQSFGTCASARPRTRHQIREGFWAATPGEKQLPVKNCYFRFGREFLYLLCIKPGNLLSSSKASMKQPAASSSWQVTTDKPQMQAVRGERAMSTGAQGVCQHSKQLSRLYGTHVGEGLCSETPTPQLGSKAPFRLNPKAG